jgi:hypothetical protein
MAYANIRLSDISGAQLQEDKVVVVVVEGRVLDCAREELAGLKAVANMVELNLRNPDGSTERIICARADWDKLMPKEKFEKLDASRGRRSNFRPNGSGH